MPGAPLPAYEHALKCSHYFNLLDARGAIAVTERVSFIGRIRTLAKGCAVAYAGGMSGLGADGPAAPSGHASQETKEDTPAEGGDAR